MSHELSDGNPTLLAFYVGNPCFHNMPYVHEASDTRQDAENWILNWKIYMGQVTELWLSCYLVLLSIHSKTRWQDSRSFMTWPIYSVVPL